MMKTKLLAKQLALACGLAALLLFPSGVQTGERTSLPAPDARLKAELLAKYQELLMEKGVCDNRGREIGSRLDELIRSAADGVRSRSSDVFKAVLKRLNYSPSNLGNFPACAFDRPVGEKLVNFGLSKVPGDLEASAEGNGCPLGGVGAGAFERTMSGNFRYWFLKSGWMVDETVWANQFHVYLKKGRQRVVQSFSTDAPGNRAELSAWAWNYPAGKGSYYALFPKSGFSYETNDGLPVRLAVTQFSPVIPNNYRETSWPVAVFKWIIVNPDDRPAEGSLMLTWANMVGWETVAPDPGSKPADFVWQRRSGGSFNRVVEDKDFKGIVLEKKGQDIRTGNALSGSMCIAASEIPGKTKVYYQAGFDGAGSGNEVWEFFAADGTLPNARESGTAADGEILAAGLAVKFNLAGRERLEIPIVVSWDFPFYEFEKGVKYRKKYTDDFAADGRQAWAIAREGLVRYREWEKAIDAFHSRIVSDPSLPDWLRQALLNELYILAETSIWDAATGLHTYLESADYLMYGTFDVDAYASWHLLRLWPELEKRNMDFFGLAVAAQDPSYKVYQYALVAGDKLPEAKRPYYWNTNKDAGMVPHDLGSPRVRPWVVLNAFDWQNGNVWKDLNPKFPLRAYRAFLHAGSADVDFLKRMFRASAVALDTLAVRFSDPTSRLPLNEGIPDQTYDTWRMKGESAYVSILWLAALQAMVKMGDILAERGIRELDGTPIRDAVEKYRSWFVSGRQALQKLWDEPAGYFHIDAFSSDIMTDQLFGAWYARLLGLDRDGLEPVVSREQARRALSTIFQRNVLGFGGGLLGAVNGRTAEGAPLATDQGDEVWAGTAFAYASHCLLEGLTEEGLSTAYGIFHTVYSPFGQGYFFKTPEAYCNPEEFRYNDRSQRYGRKLFRAQKYMRPGAVWAVYEALRGGPEVR